MSLTLITCPTCKKKFKAYPSQVKNGRKYCSLSCFYGRTGGKIRVKCASCGKEFEAYPSEIKKGRKYCSRACFFATSPFPKRKTKPIDKTQTSVLSYILGVIHGDGYISKVRVKGRKKDYVKYMIGLKVKSYDFAQKFANALKSIGLNPWVHYDKSEGKWLVRCLSKELYMLLVSNPMDMAINHPKEYICGFYESEGSASIVVKKKEILRVCMYNNSLERLEFVKLLLEKLGFKAKIYKHSRNRDKEWVLSLLGSTVQKFKFIELIKPVVKLPEKLCKRD